MPNGVSLVSFVFNSLVLCDLLKLYNITMICKECEQEQPDNDKLFKKHLLTKHKMSSSEYVLKHTHSGIYPLCQCGCGGLVKFNSRNSYNNFIIGHHAKGRKKSIEEKQKIGEKNSLNKKRWHKEHPEAAAEWSMLMRSKITEESETKRKQTLRDTYKNMSIEDNEKFSDHAKELWQRDDNIMYKARAKAAETFKVRSAAGEYDFETRNKHLSESIAQLYINGQFKFSKGEYTSTKMLKTYYYRSSWEKLYMLMLDADDDVLSWEYEFARISYEFNSKTHNYVPDFHVVKKDDKHYFVEVKPNALRCSERNSIKRIAAEKFCSSKGWIYEEWQPTIEVLRNLKLNNYIV